jgi:LytR cell envelope-related transcriptional attenuator/LytR_cpsA_psr family
VSGRHRRPEADPLPDVDLAERIAGAPVVHTASPTAPTAPSAPGRTVVARRSRAEARAARRAERRRRLLVAGAAGAAALVLVVAVVLLLVLLRGGEDESGPTPTGAARQQTLLLQVTGVDGAAAANALVGVTAREESASVVLVPSGLLVDAAGTGTIPFGETVTLPEASAPAQALTDLLGVRVDDGWVLSQQGLAALVDAVGGVEAMVDVDVLSTDPQGNQTVVVRAGTRQLDGAAAAAYATYRGEGEPEESRLSRFDDVLSGLLAALPEERAALVPAVQAAGEGSRSGLDPDGLAEVLLAMKAATGAEAYRSDVLPVNEIDTGASVPTYGIEPGQVTALMRSLFPGALLEDASGDVVRVLVENGVGTPGLVEAARAKLVAEGFRFTNGGNASSFTGEASVVLIPDGTDESLARGQRVAAALGLPDSAVNTSDRGQTVADVIVILGADFVP